MALWYRASSPTSPISSIDTAIIPNVQSSDFRDLLSYDQPITDAIITDYLTILWKSHLDICFLDTNFHTTFMEKGWDTAFNKFFLHERSSTYAHKTQFKPTLHSSTIIIPQHVQGSHWVTLIWWIIDKKRLLSLCRWHELFFDGWIYWIKILYCFHLTRFPTWRIHFD